MRQLQAQELAGSQGFAMDSTESNQRKAATGQSFREAANSGSSKTKSRKQRRLRAKAKYIYGRSQLLAYMPNTYNISRVRWLSSQHLYVWVFVSPFPRSPPPPLASVSARSSRPRRRRVRPPARPSASPALSSLPSLPPPSAHALRVVGNDNKGGSDSNG